MAYSKNILTALLAFGLSVSIVHGQQQPRVQDFDQSWKFFLGDAPAASQEKFNDLKWRSLNLPHDWSIEGSFSKDHPAGTGGGALPGGIGWYRKTFTVPAALKGKQVYIDFDGVYRNSEVWINGHLLGKRPNGYISFEYELTPYLKFGQNNVIAVRADNADQPNSRWYSGSGIYRNVWLVTTNKIAVGHWGTYVNTPVVSADKATVNIKVDVKNATGAGQTVTVKSRIVDAAGKTVSGSGSVGFKVSGKNAMADQQLTVTKPNLWSVDNPYLYKVVTEIEQNNKVLDTYTTPLGIRYFNFDAYKGFSLNGKPLKILGVCNHHDLGCLGAAFNVRAAERQLQILKAMGCNSIRTSHNPPAPELLDLCDKMGFIVMDEAFDMWKIAKTKQDYHLYWDEWHKRDLEDQLLRDRNHPSVMIWSIGNEIMEQYSQTDTSGRPIARELAAIVRGMDNRPITSALNEPQPYNNIIKSNALDLIGYNYHHQDFASFHERYPGKKFIATETTSALETRGQYDMPSDSIRRWPHKPEEQLKDGNPDNTVSAYDNVSTPWGSTHEETWKIMKKYDHLSGMYIWTGFDYLGEPTPYEWPSRSSYFGIIDLAGFPKDVYYMYQSEWTSKNVLHILPHWNWQPGKTVDVWAYYNNADEVELYLNGKSLGIKKKQGDDLHVMWRVKYEPGTIKAISRKNGKTVLTREVHTAGKPAKLQLIADRSQIKADGKDLSFVTVNVLDKNGNLVPDAAHKVSFKVNGAASIAGMDNGSQTSMESFKGTQHSVFNGVGLAVIQSRGKAGNVVLTASAAGLQPASITIKTK
ncbi:glycoside hydrolase family 2 protein [Mucilaginibacter sp. Bleaf8]|uniref:beta-galactosidase GalB n=1 Tax=Mucilaginibacter sp. Bleaf8 TaxID=2834430 RepID=UPI001BCB8067|nr:beta-galactosidase GalB [Mucilaginibacter sp. Bleaf8]MBS7563267.1 glycoside hydrolase family 2 protein [Mucilaginibacter sp. Bleaf8]